MNPQTRNLFLILFGVPLLLVGPAFLVGSSIFRAGTIDFEVHEKDGGCSIEGAIPAAMVPVALHLAPAHVMDEVREGLRDEFPGDPMKIVRAVIKDLSRCPDGVFIDVQTDCELIRVEKRDGRLEVLVDTPSEVVRAAVPFHTVASVMSAI